MNPVFFIFFAVNVLIVTGLEPDFAYPLENLTIYEGQDAIFVCVVNFGYCGKRSSSGIGDHHHISQCPHVLWTKATWTILAIDNDVIQNKARLSVTHNGYNMWMLNISDARQEDRGIYTCQITTKLTKRQSAFLEIVIPPDIISEETSNDMIVFEGSTVELVCKARGYPKPDIVWQREDNAEIISHIGPTKIKIKVPSVVGEVLTLSNVTRNETGAYLCTANNKVSPGDSKRVMLYVDFHPMVQVPNRRIKASIGTKATLVCHVEAFKHTVVNYWTRETDKIITNNKYRTSEINISVYSVQMQLEIMNLQKHDLGGYKCISNNSLGETEGYIELYGELRPDSSHTHHGVTPTEQPEKVLGKKLRETTRDLEDV